MENHSSTVLTTKLSVIRFMPPGFMPVVFDLRPSVLSGINFGVPPKLYDAPRRRNHDAERRATKFAIPRLIWTEP